MKFSQLLGVVLAGVVLGGCSRSPVDADSSPVFAKFVLSESAPDLYYRLTTSVTDDPVCGVSKSTYYQDRGEFRIYFGTIHDALGNTPMLILNGVYGRAVDGKTEVVVRDTQYGMAHEGYSRKLISFIKTGKCE